MNPRTKKILLFALAVVLILVAVVIWIRYPRTFDQAMGIDREAVNQVHVTLTGQGGNRELTILPAATAYGELMALLEEPSYIPLYLDKGNRTMTLDYEVSLSFLQGEEAYGMTFSGDKPIWFVGSGMRDRSFRTSGGEVFQQEILDFLLEQADPVD